MLFIFTMDPIRTWSYCYWYVFILFLLSGMADYSMYWCTSRTYCWHSAFDLSPVVSHDWREQATIQIVQKYVIDCFPRVLHEDAPKITSCRCATLLWSVFQSLAFEELFWKIDNSATFEMVPRRPNTLKQWTLSDLM